MDSDNYYLGYALNNAMMKEYDLSCVRCWIISGSPKSAAFKSQLLELFPESVVSTMRFARSILHYCWCFFSTQPPAAAPSHCGNQSFQVYIFVLF